MKKIAIVGSAPASVALAPYEDTDWTIWGCSPGAAPNLRRVDAFFELHRWEGFDPAFVAWMAGLECPVYTLEAQPEVPTSVIFPSAGLLEKYPGVRQSFFTSSISWMLAWAIEQDGVEEIGLWGVDLSATEEYALQKPGCHFFMLEAERRGIKITVPPESDLLRPVALYGVGSNSPRVVKLAARRAELMGRKNTMEREAEDLDRQYRAKREAIHFLAGALDAQTYFEQTWSDDHG